MTSGSHERSARQRAASLLARPSAYLILVARFEIGVGGRSRKDHRLGARRIDLVFPSEDLASDLACAFHHSALGLTIVAQEIRRRDGLGTTRVEIV